MASPWWNGSNAFRSKRSARCKSIPQANRSGGLFMKILALEFSSERRSVAVVENGDVLGEAHEQGGKHTRAFELIERALAAARLEREQIECVAVGLGPGSYMGIRIAIAIAQGWQLARGVKTAGVKSAEEARRVGLLVEE